MRNIELISECNNERGVFQLADGRERTVSYTADEDGFHPEIHTNEFGTESKNPGDAIYISSALSGPDAAIEAYGGPFPESLGMLTTPEYRAPNK